MMESITVTVDNQEKARMLSELLKALDFVNEVKLNRTSQQPTDEEKDGDTDFFALAGLWKDRQVDIETIRRQAWPER